MAEQLCSHLQHTLLRMQHLAKSGSEIQPGTKNDWHELMDIWANHPSSIKTICGLVNQSTTMQLQKNVYILSKPFQISR